MKVPVILSERYTLKEELTNAGAGTSCWGFVTDITGERLFIKEFLTPIYPANTSDYTPEQIKAKTKIAEAFYKHKSEYYKRLNRANNGNLIFIRDFFRHESKYYIVTEAVTDGVVNASNLHNLTAKLSDEKILVLLKSLAFTISRLHLEGIIHCDLKPANILIKRTEEDFYTAKLIDFDSGIIEDDQDITEDLQFDTVYMSPEMLKRSVGEAIALTDKSDIFALGIIFYEYLTGDIPAFDVKKYGNIAEAVLDGAKPSLNLPSVKYKPLITSMLNIKPEGRPSAWEVFKALKSFSADKSSSSDSYTPPPDSKGPGKTDSSSSKSTVGDKYFNTPDPL